MQYLKYILVFVIFYSSIAISQGNEKDTIVFLGSCERTNFFIRKGKSTIDTTKIVNHVNYCDSVYELTTNYFYAIFISEKGVKILEADYKNMYLHGSFITYDTLGRKIWEGSKRQVITKRFNTTSYYSYYDKNIREYSYIDSSDTHGYLRKEIIVNAYRRKYLIKKYSENGILIKTYKKKKKCGFLCSFRRSFG